MEVNVCVSFSFLLQLSVLLCVEGDVCVSLSFLLQLSVLLCVCVCVEGDVNGSVSLSFLLQLSVLLILVNSRREC